MQLVSEKEVKSDKWFWIFKDAFMFSVVVYLLSNISEWLIWGENNFFSKTKVVWMIFTGLMIGWLNWRSKNKIFNAQNQIKS